MSGRGYKQLKAENYELPDVETKREAPPAYTTQPAAVKVTPQVVQDPHSGVAPKDYLVMSILTTFFCCMPISIFALFKSLEARGAVQRGDFATAEASSQSAYRLNKISIVVGVICTIITILVVLLYQLRWIIPLATHDDSD